VAALSALVADKARTSDEVQAEVTRGPNRTVLVDDVGEYLSRRVIVDQDGNTLDMVVRDDAPIGQEVRVADGSVVGHVAELRMRPRPESQILPDEHPESVPNPG
jgi:hypothetical protein